MKKLLQFHFCCFSVGIEPATTAEAPFWDLNVFCFFALWPDTIIIYNWGDYQIFEIKNMLVEIWKVACLCISN